MFDKLYRLLLAERVEIDSLKSSRLGFSPSASASCSVNLSFLGMGGGCAASKVVESFSEELRLDKSAVASLNCSSVTLDLLWLAENYWEESLISERLIRNTLSRVLKSACTENADIKGTNIIAYDLNDNLLPILMITLK